MILNSKEAKCGRGCTQSIDCGIVYDVVVHDGVDKTVRKESVGSARRFSESQLHQCH